MKAIAQNQKTTTVAAPKPQAAMPIQTPALERLDLATQLASATRLGHRLHAVNIHNAKESAAPVQRATQAQPDMAEDEEDLVGQARFASAPSSLRNGIPSIQRAELPQAMEDEDEEKSVGQLKSASKGTDPLLAEASPNKTGLPDGLKSGLEHYSGMDMSDVKVHYNSAKPAQLQALAYTQGTDIHVGPGQEVHLPHEGWHVVQQMQGRVKPTMQMKGVSINDDAGLEKDADVMGAMALAGAAQLQGAPVRRTGPGDPANVSFLRRGDLARLGAVQLVTLQRRIRNQAVRRLPHRATEPLQHVAGGIVVIQKKSVEVVKKEIKDGGMVSNMTGSFLSSHGQGAKDNVDAAKIHARRKKIPLTNTVIKDLSALRSNIHAQEFANLDDMSWEVTTGDPIKLIDTTKKNPPIGPIPLKRAPLEANAKTYGGETFNYAEDGTVKSVVGANLTTEELNKANESVKKPKSQAKPQIKNQFRVEFLTKVNEHRTLQSENQDHLWLKQNFQRINDKELNDKTPEEIKAIEERLTRVTVFISKKTGEIFHLDETDDDD